MSRVVYFNGQFLPESAARLSIYDSALLMGDMAFEVTRTFNHQPFRLEQHIDRLFHSLSVLRIDPGISGSELLAATHQTLARNLPTEAGDVDWNILHNVSRGPSRTFADAFAPGDFQPTIVISCYPLVARMAGLARAYTEGLDLVVPAQRSLPTELLDASIKTRSRVHYQLANLQAEALLPHATAALVDPDGFLTEGTNGNLFVVRDATLLTPAARNLLPGITREVVFELARGLAIPCREADITPAQAIAADEMFVTSTSIGILHARTLQGHTFGSGAIGPLTARLRAAFVAEVGLDLAAQARQYAQRILPH